jgi:phospholipid/cholesterol/gamma-HCH transport system substrate-binding protein
MAGVRVGRVSKINFDQQTYEALVTMSIAPEFKAIPKDTSAAIFTAGLLGEQYISLEAGGDEKYLKQGDELKLTQSALVLEQVIGQFLYSQAEGGSDKK